MNAARGALSGALLGLKALASCIVIGALVVTSTIGIVGIVFSGDLAQFRQQGIGLGLLAAAVLGFVGAVGLSYRGTICNPQDATAVALSVAAGAVAMRMGTDNPQSLYATVAMLIALTSLITGAAFFLIGRLRLGGLARFVPQTVMGGFLAATGMLLVMGAVEMVAPWPFHLGEPKAVRAFAPLIGGAAMAVAARLTTDGRVVPACFALMTVMFYGWLGLSGMSLDDAARAGLLLGPFQNGGFSLAFGACIVAEADYGQLWIAAPTIMLVAFLAVVGAILNASALAFATGTPVAINRDLQVLGVANAAAGLGGGLIGYHVFSETMLARRLTGAEARWIGLGVALICALAFLKGAWLLSMLPVSVFAATVAYLGFDFLYEWLWVERRRMPVEDFAVVALMLAVAGLVGFLEAVGVGVLLAAVTFAVGYARVDPVLRIAPGSSHQTIVEGAEGASQAVVGALDRTLVATLTGYLFFGVADRVRSRLVDALAAQIDPPETLILRMDRVAGVDASGAFALRRLGEHATARGVRIVLVGAPASVLRRLAVMKLFDGAARHGTLEDALIEVEESAAQGASPAPPPPVHYAALIARLRRPDPVTGRAWLQPLHPAPAGATLFREGDPSDCLLFLLEGRLEATRAAPGGAAVKIAVFLPGAMVGEIGLLTGAQRSATVVATRDSLVCKLGAQDFAALARADPALALDVNASIARMLAERLVRASARVGELSR